MDETEDTHEGLLAARPVTAGTVLRYLAFDRAAIADIAAAPRALWLGIPLVVAGGLARDYDGEDLLAEPWHLLGGLVISTCVSSLMAGLLWLLTRRSPQRPPFLAAWGRFVALFWLSAPMAWLYAIPWERWLDPLTATKVNVATLAVVSLWRVALITLVAAELFGLRRREAFPAVGLVSAGAMWLAAARLPILQIMGGVRRTDSEDWLSTVGVLLMLASVTLAAVCLVSTVSLLVILRKRTSPESHVPLTGGRVAASGWAFVAASVAAGLALLPTAQDEQHNRRRFADYLRGGETTEAIDFAAGLTTDDFPPHWDPLPRERTRTGRPLNTYRMNVLLTAARRGAPDWLMTRLKAKAWPGHYQERGYWVEAERDRLSSDVSLAWSLAETDGERETLVESLRAAALNEDSIRIVVNPLFTEWGVKLLPEPSDDRAVTPDGDPLPDDASEPLASDGETIDPDDPQPNDP